MKYIKEFLAGAFSLAWFFIVVPAIMVFVIVTILNFMVTIVTAKGLAVAFIIVVLITLLILTLHDNRA